MTCIILSNDHELINVEQSIGSANSDDDADVSPKLSDGTIDGELTHRELGFLDTVYRALNGQFDAINYDIADSMTSIKDHEDVVESLQDKNLLTTIDAGDDDSDEDNDDSNGNESDDGDEEDDPERELEGSNAETIRVGETRNKYYRPHDDAGPLVDSSFNDKIGENGEESLSHRLGVLLIGKYYQQQGYDVSFYEDDDFTEAVFDVSVEATEESPSDVGRVVEVETTPEHKPHVASDYTHLASSIKESVWVVENKASAYRLVTSVQEKLDSSPNKDNSLDEINNQVNAPGLSKIFTLNGLLDELS